MIKWQNPQRDGISTEFGDSWKLGTGMSFLIPSCLSGKKRLEEKVYKFQVTMAFWQLFVSVHDHYCRHLVMKRWFLIVEGWFLQWFWNFHRVSSDCSVSGSTSNHCFIQSSRKFNSRHTIHRSLENGYYVPPPFWKPKHLTNNFDIYIVWVTFNPLFP